MMDLVQLLFSRLFLRIKTIISMQYSIIQKSQLEGAHRLDAEYYQPEYLEVENKLEGVKTSLLKDLSLSIKKGIFDLSPDNYLDKGIPLLRTTDAKDPLTDFSTVVFISDEIHKKHSVTTLYPHDLVFTKIGASIGDVAMLPELFPKYNFSQNVAGVRLNEQKIKSGYLLAFLLSKFGRKQIIRSQMISGQGKLELADLRNLAIPVLQVNYQNAISKLVSQAQVLKNDSLNYYVQAENLLLEELGLTDFEPREDLSFVTNLSEVVEASRADADFFQPKYEELISKIKNKNAKKLGDLVSMKKGFEPGSGEYQEEGKLFIRVSSLSRFGIDSTDQKYLSEELYQKLKTDFEPKIGEVLLTKDATPGIAYVVKEPVEGIISGGILRLTVREGIETEYLALCINSIIGKMQAERDAGGSVISHWKPEQIRNLLIPVLPKYTQQKIADLVRRSHEARKKSKKLLEEAKTKVEEMIDSTSSL